MTLRRTRGWLTALGVAALIGAACSPADERLELPAVPEDAVTTTTPAPLPIAPISVPGRLLVLGDDHEITIMNPNGANPRVIAGPAPDDVERDKPSWSTDGTRVAWTEGIFGETTELVIASTDGAEITRTEVPFPAQYIAWGPDDAAIALMGNDFEGDLRILTHDVATGANFDIGNGVPMYFDWAPDGAAILLHIDDSFELVPLDGSERTLVTTDGEFRVGAFVGGNVVYAMDAGIGEVLVVGEDISTRPRGILRYAAPAAFVAHPDGDRLAILARGARESQSVVEFDDPLLSTLAPARLEILDLRTGELETVIEAPVIAWFWSPDGERLLYGAPDTETGDVRIRWWVYEDGESTRFAAFTPNGDFAREYLAFFDQFARTTRFWSPDSTAFTYSGGDPTTNGIWVQVVGEPEPHLVARGRVAVWSPTG